MVKHACFKTVINYGYVGMNRLHAASKGRLSHCILCILGGKRFEYKVCHSIKILFETAAVVHWQDLILTSWLKIVKGKS